MTVAATQPYTAANLQTEINSGPYHTTFAPQVTAQDWPDIATLLNDVNGSANGPVYHADITGAQLLAAVNPAELGSLSSNDKDTFKFYTDSAEVVISDANLQSWLAATFTQLSQPLSHAALAALQTRTGSRAEVLWGAGTVVTTNDVQFAMTGSGPLPHIT